MHPVGRYGSSPFNSWEEGDPLVPDQRSDRHHPGDVLISTLPIEPSHRRWSLLQITRFQHVWDWLHSIHISTVLAVLQSFFLSLKNRIFGYVRIQTHSSSDREQLQAIEKCRVNIEEEEEEKEETDAARRPHPTEMRSHKEPAPSEAERIQQRQTCLKKEKEVVATLRALGTFVESEEVLAEWPGALACFHNFNFESAIKNAPYLNEAVTLEPDQIDAYMTWYNRFQIKIQTFFDYATFPAKMRNKWEQYRLLRLSAIL